ncbi:MAG: PHP domain-containing protein [Phycisphaerae bacterium]|nr:PHP domain-containing protein [Phycisphaerae bacterium]
MRKVRADLHLHTCLSPCADTQMQATAIVEQAKKVGLDMIGICDHNSAENVAAVVKAGVRKDIAVIPGMEVTSSEEVHILGLFNTEQDLMHLQDMVYENLPGENSQEAFGPQLVVDEWDNVVGTNSRLLIGATTLTVEQIVDAIHKWAGLAIASHIDRERFSLIGQLGFIPEGLKLDALEVSRPSSGVQEYGYPVVTFSDAHFLEDIGRSPTCFMMEDASLAEIKKALRREMGRRVAEN